MMSMDIFFADQVAERNTWPKVEMIRSHCAVEMGLEQCVQTLRRQLMAENQVRCHTRRDMISPSPIYFYQNYPTLNRKWVYMYSQWFIKKNEKRNL